MLTQRSHLMSIDINSGSGVGGVGTTGDILPSTVPPSTFSNISSFFNFDSVAPAPDAPTTQTVDPSILIALTPPNTLSIAEFSRIVNQAINALQELIHLTDTSDLLLNRSAHGEGARRAAGLADIRSGMVGLSGQESTVLQNQQFLAYLLNNGPNADSVAQYNNLIQASNVQTHAMYNAQIQFKQAEDTYNVAQANYTVAQQNYNDAVVAFANGDITQAQFNQATADWNTAQNNWSQAQTAWTNAQASYASSVSTYNAYATSFNDQVNALLPTIVTIVEQYNAKVAETNAEIDAINQQRASYGITLTLPHQDTLPVPTLSQLPTIPSSSPPAPSSPTVPYELPPIVYTPADPLATISLETGIQPINSAEQSFFDYTQSLMDPVNTAINNYNNLIATTAFWTTTMNQAVIDYQNGAITDAQYNNIVSQYNQFANDTNGLLQVYATAYSNAVDNFNSIVSSDSYQNQIINFNEARRNDPNLPIPKELLPQQPTINKIDTNSLLLPTNIAFGPPPPDVSPVPLLMQSIMPIPVYGSVTPTNPLNYLATFFSPIFSSAFPNLTQLNQFLNLQSAYREFLIFNSVTGNNLITNNAFIERLPPVFLSSGGPAGSVSGVALASIILGLDNRSLGAIISQSIIDAARSAELAPIPQTVADQILFYGLGLLNNASLSAALPTLSILGKDPSLLAGGGPAVKAVLALSLVNQINSLIGSNAINSAVQSFLAAAGLGPTDIAKVQGILTSGLQLGLLQVALLQTAKSLGLPGLIPQVLGNLTGIPNLAQLLGIGAGLSLNDVLANPVSTVYLKSTLANELVFLKGVSQASADQLVNGALNSVIGNTPFLSDTEFRIGLIRGFSNAGLDPATAIQLADQAQSVVRTEILQRDLDTTFINSALTQASLQNDLFQRQDLNNAIGRTLQNEDIQTKREFGDRLTNELQLEGLNRSDARNLANQVVATLQSEQLKNAFTSAQVNRQILEASIVNGLVQKGYSQDQAQNIAATSLDNVFAKQFAAELLLRESLSNELKLLGISTQTAAELAAGASVALIGADVLRSIGAGQILARAELAERLTIEITNSLKPTLGTPQALSIATQLAAAIVGRPSPSPDQIVTDDIRNPTSVLNQLDAVVFYVKAALQDRGNQALTDSFSNFVRPSYSLFDLSERFLDPANTLLLTAAWGAMYQGVGTEPTNYLKSVDIPI